jgi:hypothetical protein
MKTLLGVVAVLALVLVPVQARANIVTLTDLNTTVKVNTGTQAGMYSWVVNGVEQIYQQWFWFRVGNDPATPEASINTLTQTGIGFTNRYLNVTYGGGGVAIDLTYNLTGGTAGGGSDVAETIRIVNTTTRSMVLHFFQYSDFDLNGQIGGQTARVVNVNTVQQQGGGMQLSETVVTPAPNHFAVDFWPTTLNQLNDAVATTLNGPAQAGPGDVTWAFQWDFTIGAGHSAIISKDKNLRVIPEPGSMVLLGSGLLGLAAAVRRRLRK